MHTYWPIDRSNIAKDWHARGFSCGTWIDHARREWSYPVRETDELFMLLDGELVLEMDGQSIQPLAGEEIRILAGKTHTIRNVGKSTARWLYGQQREPFPLPENPSTVQERSFQPNLKRKRRPEKRNHAVGLSKEV